MEITILASPSKNTQLSIPQVRAFPACDRFTKETNLGIDISRQDCSKIKTKTKQNKTKNHEIKRSNIRSQL